MKRILRIIASSLGAAFFTILLQLLVSRLLSVSDFGMYASISSMLAIAAPLSSSGISNLYLRRASIQSDSHTGIYLVARRVLVHSCTWFYAVLGLLAGALFANWWIPLLMGTSIFAVGWQNFLIALSQFKERFRPLGIAQVIYPATRLILVLPLFAIGFDDRLFEIALLLCLANFLIIICLRKMVNVYSNVPLDADTSISSAALGEFFRSSISFSLNGTANVAQLQLIVLVVAMLYGVEKAAFVSVSNTIVSAVYLVSNAVFSIYLLPKVQKKKYRSCIERRLDIARNSMWAALLGGAFSIIGYLLTNVAISTVFSDKYLGAVGFLALLWICVPFRFVTTALGVYLLNEEGIRRKVASIFFCISVQMIFPFVLIYFGMSFEYVALGVIFSEILLCGIYAFLAISGLGLSKNEISH